MQISKNEEIACQIAQLREKCYVFGTEILNVRCVGHFYSIGQNLILHLLAVYIFYFFDFSWLFFYTSHIKKEDSNYAELKGSAKTKIPLNGDSNV